MTRPLDYAEYCTGCMMADPELAWRWINRVVQRAGKRICKTCLRVRERREFASWISDGCRVWSRQCRPCGAVNRLVMIANWHSVRRHTKFKSNVDMLAVGLLGKRFGDQVVAEALECHKDTVRYHRARIEKRRMMMLAKQVGDSVGVLEKAEEIYAEKIKERYGPPYGVGYTASADTADGDGRPHSSHTV